MRAVFINMDAATDRRAFMEAQGRRLGIVLERFSAVTPADFATGQYEALADLWERPMRPGEVAIFLSHLALWRQAAQTPEGLIVLEDDAVLSSRFPAALHGLPPGFELINLEDVSRRKFFVRGSARPGDGFEVWRLARDRSGAGGYWISQSGARKLVALAEHRSGLADAFMFAMAGLVVGQAEPALVKQVHLLAEDGINLGLTTTSSSTPPGLARKKARAARFVWRRFQTQARMAATHLRRLIDVEFRRPRLDLAAFRTALGQAADHSRS